MDHALHSDHHSKPPDTRNTLTQELISDGGHDEQFVYPFMCSRPHCRKRFKSMDDFRAHFHGCGRSRSFKLDTRNTQKQELISVTGIEQVSLHEKSDMDSQTKKKRGKKTGNLAEDIGNSLNQNLMSKHKSQEAHPGMPLYKGSSTRNGNDICLTCSRMLPWSGHCYKCDDEHYLKRFLQKIPKRYPRECGSKLYGDRRESFIMEKKKTQIENQFLSVSSNEYNLCLLYESLTESILTLAIIGVSSDGPSRESFITLDRSPWISGMGFGSLGTSCYLVGGVIDKKPLPCDVFICDISKEVKKWAIGPPLNYGKPDPIVFTINEKLYVLAGRSALIGGAHENIFEVFDPQCGRWKLLEDPPFLYLFEKRYPYPKYLGHTVIGSVIYLQVSQSKTDETPALYSFNTENEIWSQFLGDSGPTSFAPGSNEQILHNLRCGDWSGGRDVVDYMMFHTTERELKNLEVYAVDLTSSIEDFQLRMSKLMPSRPYFNDREHSESDDEVWDGLGLLDLENFSDSDREESYEEAFRVNDADQNKEIECVKNRYEIRDFKAGKYVLLVDGKVPSIPVYGLAEINRFIPQQALLGSCVMHLRENLFALVISSTSVMQKDDVFERCTRVNTCTFEASVVETLDGDMFSERHVGAYNVNEMMWVKSGLGMLIRWCKVPNDGRQSQFRRPQKLCGTSGKFRSYPDDVADQVVHKKNVFPNYVQRMKLPQSCTSRN